MAQKLKYYVREFLNPPGHNGMASILAVVYDYDAEKNEILEKHSKGESLKGRWCPSSVELSISDCSRTIHLDFDVGRAEDREANLAKLDRIIEVFTEFRTHVQAEADFAEKFAVILREQREKAGDTKEPDPDDDII